MILTTFFQKMLSKFLSNHKKYNISVFYTLGNPLAGRIYRKMLANFKLQSKNDNI